MVSIVVGSVGSFIGIALTVIGYLLRSSFEDFKKEVRGLREDLTDLTGSISDLAIKVSTGNVRLDTHEQEISYLRQNYMQLASDILEVKTVQDRCRSCTPR